jgi:hypothetical protein
MEWRWRCRALSASDLRGCEFREPSHFAAVPRRVWGTVVLQRI